MSGCLKKETLLAFVDGEMALGEIQLAERHIAECGACRAELESVRATSMKVNALLNSLVPSEAPYPQPSSVISIPQRAANARTRWAAWASVGVLSAAAVLWVLAIRGSHSTHVRDVAKTAVPAPSSPFERNTGSAKIMRKSTVVPIHRARLAVRRFQALDDGEPIQTGMIYRVSLPAPVSADGLVLQSTKRIPAEVIVDDFGKVRAIRFLQ